MKELTSQNQKNQDNVIVTTINISFGVILYLNKLVTVVKASIKNCNCNTNKTVIKT